MNRLTEFLKSNPQLSEEAEQLAGRFEFENGMKRATAESRAIGLLKDKYNLWGK